MSKLVDYLLSNGIYSNTKIEQYIATNPSIAIKDIDVYTIEKSDIKRWIGRLYLFGLIFIPMILYFLVLSNSHFNLQNGFVLILIMVFGDIFYLSDYNRRQYLIKENYNRLYALIPVVLLSLVMLINFPVFWENFINNNDLHDYFYYLMNILIGIKIFFGLKRFKSVNYMVLYTLSTLPIIYILCTNIRNFYANHTNYMTWTYIYSVLILGLLMAEYYFIKFKILRRTL